MSNYYCIECKRKVGFGDYKCKRCNGGDDKMSEMKEEKEKVKGDMPKWKGFIGVTGWENETKDGKPYINIKMDNYVKLYPYEPKEK